MEQAVKEQILAIAREMEVKVVRDLPKDVFDKYPHIFLLGCIMNVQMKSKKAFAVPVTIAKILGSYDFSAFLEKDEDFYVEVFEKHKLHRYKENKAKVFYKAVQRIHNYYNDDVRNIWNDEPSSAELIMRLKEFDGVGIKVATMTTNLLLRDYDIKIKDRHCIDVSPDVHVKRTMKRLGLVKTEDNESVMLAGRMISPEYPALLDYGFWKIGYDKICEDNACHADKCPYGKFCSKNGLKL